MSALIKMYDNFTGSTKASLSITTMSIAYNFYRFYSYPIPFSVYNPTIVTASSAAGAAFACLAKAYFVSNPEVRTTRERNTVFATCALAVGLFGSFELFNPYSPLSIWTNRLFSYFGSNGGPLELACGITNGFLITLLFLQLVQMKTID